MYGTKQVCFLPSKSLLDNWSPMKDCLNRVPKITGCCASSPSKKNPTTTSPPWYCVVAPHPPVVVVFGGKRTWAKGKSLSGKSSSHAW